jgi:hypothetical protein
MNIIVPIAALRLKAIVGRQSDASFRLQHTEPDAIANTLRFDPFLVETAAQEFLVIDKHRARCHSANRKPLKAGDKRVYRPVPIFVEPLILLIEPYVERQLAAPS